MSKIESGRIAAAGNHKSKFAFATVKRMNWRRIAMAAGMLGMLIVGSAQAEEAKAKGASEATGRSSGSRASSPGTGTAFTRAYRCWRRTPTCRCRSSIGPWVARTGCTTTTPVFVPRKTRRCVFPAAASVRPNTSCGGIRRSAASARFTASAQTVPGMSR